MGLAPPCLLLAGLFFGAKREKLCVCEEQFWSAWRVCVVGQVVGRDMAAVAGKALGPLGRDLTKNKKEHNEGHKIS